MTLENYTPRKGDKVLIEAVVEEVFDTAVGVGIFFDGGFDGDRSAARASDVVKLVERKETPGDLLFRLKEEGAKWQKLAEEFRDKREKLEKFAPSSDWTAGQQ